MYQANENRYGSMRYNRCGRSGLLLSADAIPAFLKEHYGLTDEDILLETGTDY